MLYQLIHFHRTEHLIFIHICGIKIQNKVFLDCVGKFNQVISKMPLRVEKWVLCSREVYSSLE